VNSFAPIDPALIDFQSPEVGLHDGYPAELAAGDTIDVLKDVCGSASREFPQALWIEPSNWADKARDNDKYKTWPANYCDRFTNQTPNHFCTCHSLGTNFEICRNRQRGIIYPEGAKANPLPPTTASTPPPLAREVETAKRMGNPMMSDPRYLALSKMSIAQLGEIVQGYNLNIGGSPRQIAAGIWKYERQMASV